MYSQPFPINLFCVKQEEYWITGVLLRHVPTDQMNNKTKIENVNISLGEEITKIKSTIITIRSYSSNIQVCFMQFLHKRYTLLGQWLFFYFFFVWTDAILKVIYFKKSFILKWRYFVFFKIQKTKKKNLCKHLRKKYYE